MKNFAIDLYLSDLMFGFERKKIITLKIFLKPYLPWLLKNILFKTGLGEKIKIFFSIFNVNPKHILNANELKCRNEAKTYHITKCLMALSGQIFKQSLMFHNT